jgi:hypothetical protein
MLILSGLHAPLTAMAASSLSLVQRPSRNWATCPYAGAAAPPPQPSQRLTGNAAVPEFFSLNRKDF